MQRPIARGGPSRTVVYAVRANGTSPGFEFYRDELTEKEQAQMLRLFNKMAEQGRIANKEQFKRIEGTDKLWEFKNFKIRMPCYFLPGNLVVITHGFRKYRDRIDPGEIGRAESIMREDAAYFAGQGAKK
jgi:hypothetical protein